MECPICFYAWNKETAMPCILNCGHSICIKCSKDLVVNGQIACPTCSNPTIFQVKRLENESNPGFAERCIETLTKNHTLLSLIPQKTIVRSQTRDFRFGMRCKKHDLLIHSYVTRPYSMLCDKCLDDIKGFNLNIVPFPEVLETCREKLRQIRVNMNTLKEALETEKVEEKDLKKDLENHFVRVSDQLQEAEALSKKKLSEKVEDFKKESKADYKKIEEIVSRVKINQQRLGYLSTLPIGTLIQERSTLSSLFSSSIEKVSDAKFPNFLINLALKPSANQVFLELLKKSIMIKTRKSKSRFWLCLHCRVKNVEGKVQCNCNRFRPLDSYPNIMNNPLICTEIEISEMQQRRKIEMNLIDQLDLVGENNVWYIINADWVNSWKSFVFNKPLRAGIQVPEIGILPPGAINNLPLFKDGKELKAKLKGAVHYRAVNQKVWEAYIFIYGGGPEVIRTKPNIYE